MTIASRWMVIVVVAAHCIGSCAGDPPCRTKGAEREQSVCACPKGTRLFGNEADNTSECVADDTSASERADSGREKRDAASAGLDGSGVDLIGTRADGAAGDASESRGDASGATPDEPCAVENQLRCVVAGSAARQQCSGGRWIDASNCPEGEVCDSADSSQGTVTCRAALEVCKGNADKPACDGALMQFCGKSGLAERSTPCASKVQCELGLALGACAPCVPGTFRCSAATLEKCTVDGQGFEAMEPACASAALCNAAAGACTSSTCVAGTKNCKGDTLQTCNATLTGFDETPCGAGLCDAVGGQCDVCLPNTTTCDGNSVKTCNAAGQGQTTARCPNEKPICTGNGNCVQCEQPSDCPTAGECSVAVCNTATGSCASTFKASGTDCSSGVCNGSGSCGSAPKCGDGVKNQASEECDDGNALQDDGCLNNCKTARCGDGVLRKSGAAEACDLSVTGTSPWECSEGCQKLSMYTGCASDNDCSPGESCQGGVMICTRSCPNGGTFDTASGCPAPQKAGTSLRAMCTQNFVKLCVLAECGSDGDCPDGSRCIRNNEGANNDPSYFSSVCTNAAF